MPFALATIGLLLIIAGARGTSGDLKKLLVEDFTGDKNFFMWIISIGSAGALGYIPDFRQFSRAFMALIIIAMVLSQRGFFNKFVSAFDNVGSSDAPDNPNSLENLLNDFRGFSLVEQLGQSVPRAIVDGVTGGNASAVESAGNSFRRFVDQNIYGGRLLLEGLGAKTDDLGKR